MGLIGKRKMETKSLRLPITEGHRADNSVDICTKFELELGIFIPYFQV